MELQRRPAAILNEVSEPVVFPLTDVEKEQIKELIDFAFLINPKIQGFSMVQVGVLKRIAMIKLGKKPFIIINPEVVNTLGLQRSEESCMSVDAGVKGRDFYRLSRPAKGTIRYYNMDGKEIITECNKHDIRIFCHEIDHMNGILISDKGKFYKSIRIK